MLCTAPALRTAAIGCRIQPTLFTPCTYTTTSSSSVRSKDTTTTPRIALASRNVAFQNTRSASTATHPSGIQSAPSTSANLEVLNWNDFFRLRRQRRFWQLGSSIGTGAGGFVGGAAVLSNADLVSALIVLESFYDDPGAIHG